MSITFDFEGVIEGINNDKYGDCVRHWGPVGTKVQGYFSYDPIWQNSHPQEISNTNRSYCNYIRNPDGTLIYPDDAAIKFQLRSTVSDYVLEPAYGDQLLGMVRAMVEKKVMQDSIYIKAPEAQSNTSMDYFLIDFTGTKLNNTDLPSSIIFKDWSECYVKIDNKTNYNFSIKI